MKNEISVGPAGWVKLVDTMPQTDLDLAVVQAARTSNGAGSKGLESDTSLIRYLMRHKHTSPFEMVEFKFHLKMPIFVARQWMRHRMASINEYSARYAAVPDECAIPRITDIRTQSHVNKQGSDLLDFPGDEADLFVDQMKLIYKQAYSAYTQALKAGVAREQARMLLPQNMYTEFYWKIDLHNLLNFLKLRMDPHAQKEIQDFAKACHELITPLVPITIKAFEDYVLKAVTLSYPDLVCLRTMLASKSTLEEIGKQQGLGKTEIAELETKFRKLCINPYAIKLQNKKREDI
jgi:thymidylate synthase (FAD)